MLARTATCCALAAAVYVDAAALNFMPVRITEGPDYALVPSCIEEQLRILALIEKFEVGELGSSEALISAAAHLETANMLCRSGNVEEALSFYRSSYRHLDREIREIDAAGRKNAR